MAGKKRGMKPFHRSVAASLPAKINRRKSSDVRGHRLIQLPKSTVTAFVDTAPSSLSNPIPTYDCDPAIANSFDLGSSHTDELKIDDSAIQLGEESEYGDGYLSIGGFRVYADDSVESDGFEEREWIADDIDSSEDFDSDSDCSINYGDYEIDDEMMDDYVEGVGGNCEILSSVWFENDLEDVDSLEFSDDQDGFGRAPAVEEYISLYGGKRRRHQELKTMKHQTRKTRQPVKKQVTNNKSKSRTQSKSKIKTNRKLSLHSSAPKTSKKRSSSHSAPSKLQKTMTRYSDKPVPFVSSGIIRSNSALEDSTENQSKRITNIETTPASSSKVGAFELHTTGFGSKMLAKMGFIEGTGLGKDGQGMVRPIEPIQRPKSLGLGNQFSEVKNENDVKEKIVKEAVPERSFEKRKKGFGSKMMKSMGRVGYFEKHAKGFGSKMMKNMGQVGSFEKHTKGFGSKMMKNMGFVAGKGLGKKSQGILKPLKSVRRPKFRGLGAKL